MKNPDIALQEALDLVAQFSGVIGTISNNDKIKAACDQSPVTNGRTFRNIMFDDILNVFELMMTDVPRKEQPIEFYRVIMQMRSGKKTSAEQASEQLRARMQGHAITPPRFIPDMFRIATGIVHDSLLKRLENQWKNITNSIASCVFSEGAFHAVNNYEVITEQLQNYIDGTQAKRGQQMTGTSIPITYLSSGSTEIQVTKNNNTGGMSTQLQALIANHCENVTERAKDKPLVYGRDPELKRLNEILLHNKKPYALIHGEEGVGQGAVVNAFSRYLQSDQAPKRLQGATIYRFSLDHMMFGKNDGIHKYPADVLKNLISETVAHNEAGKPPIVLYLDNLGLHAGDSHSHGQNLGILRNILAHEMRSQKFPLISSLSDESLFTLDHNDRELMKQFQRIDVPPLSHDNTLEELRNHAKSLEKIHGIEISGDVLQHLVRKTDMNMPDEAQSGKSIRILDMAAAAVEAADLKVMDEKHVEQAISNDTKIALTVISSEISDKIRDLEPNLLNCVFGQDDAVKKITSEIRLVGNGLHDPNKPLGVFYLNAPTGVGKTHLCKKLALHLFDDENALIRVDMTNFTEKHTVSRLIGAPPGYVGYGDEGPLDEVKKKPFSVVLIDEEDKAHPEVKSALLRMLDEGILIKNDGKKLNFRNTVIIMTSNMGAASAQDAFSSSSMGFHNKNDIEREADAQKARQAEIKQKLSPEFRNRVTEVNMQMLTRPSVEKIAQREINTASRTLTDQKKYKGMTLTVAPNVIQELADIGFDPLMGARPMERAVKQSFKIPLNDWLGQNAHGILGETFELVVKGIKNGFDVEVKKPELLALPAPSLEAA